jgi:hypothetical protein
MEIPIEIKKLFLSFLQTYFTTEYSGLKWNVDQRKTQIFIGDSQIASPEVIEKIPSIVLKRGIMQYGMTSIDQVAKQSVDGKEKQRADIIRATINLICTSSSGIQAENLASKIFILLTAYKDQLRKNGIHQIVGITLGEEQRVRGDAADRLSAVTVSVSFAYQIEVRSGTRDYALELYMDATPRYTLQEYLQYTVSGIQITLALPLTSGTAIYADYMDAVTLTEYSHELLQGLFDGVNKVYYLAHDPYGYKYIWQNFIYDAINTN